MFSDLFLFSMEHICLHHLRLGLVYSTIYWFWWYFFPTFYICIFQLKTKFFSFSGQRNWVFATKKNFLIPVFFQPDGVNLRYFKLSLFDLTQCIVWNLKDLRHISGCINIGVIKSEFVAKTQFFFVTRLSKKINCKKIKCWLFHASYICV